MRLAAGHVDGLAQRLMSIGAPRLSLAELEARWIVETATGLSGAELVLGLQSLATLPSMPLFRSGPGP